MENKGIDDIQKEISNLKNKLNEIDKEKELWFKKKEDLKLDISSLIKQIKDIKSIKDKSNIDIIELKKERDKYNDEVKLLINEIK